LSGSAVWLTPDVYTTDPVCSISAGADGVSTVVKVGVINRGSASIGPPVHVALYRDTVAPANFIATDNAGILINPGDTGYVSVTIPDIRQYPALHIVACVNNDGTFHSDGTIAPVQTECDSTHNEQTTLNTRLSQSMEKNATLRRNVVLHAGDGTYANPVSALYGDTIEYAITATNPIAGTAIIRDTLPLYLQFATTVGASTPLGAPLPFVESHTIAPQTNVPHALSWTVSGLTRAAPYAVVTLRATIEQGASASQPLFPNRAWVGVIDSNNDTTAFLTNYTYHQGAGISLVAFSASAGGNIYNADRQAVDYSTAPRSGILVAPDEGYRFAGWEHAGYYSHRGAYIPPAAGIERYDTLAIYGDVTLHARFEPVAYPIRYLLHGGENAPANPSSYTIEDAAITLAPPYKAGDVFIGWTAATADAFTGTTGDIIAGRTGAASSAGTTGNAFAGATAASSAGTTGNSFAGRTAASAAFSAGRTGTTGDAPQEVVTIPAGSTGERTYYANYLYSGREAADFDALAGAGDRVWSAGGELYVRTSRAGVGVRVYTPDGVLHRRFTIPAPGITKYPLLPGLYIVALDDDAGQKVILTPPD
ncbi:MAG: hypothetical protein LBG96_09325, partial [Tannerella sp.]|nr:hypothetical protein [Tannerella sp.]